MNDGALRRLSPILAALLLLLSAGDAPAREREKVEIAMVLFRGMTRAEQGFLDKLNRSPDFEVTRQVFDAEQDPGKLERIIDELDKGRYRLIYVFGTTATQQVMKRIKNTPIVFNVVQRPVEAGVVRDLKRPGMNATGATNYVPMENALSTLVLLMHIHKLGFLYYAGDPSTGYQKTDLLTQQKNFGFRVVDLPIRSKETISLTLKRLLDEKPEAVLVPADSFVKANGSVIFGALNKNRIPSIVIIPEMVRENGALLALGPDYYTLGELAAENALEILKGKKPSELPVRMVQNLNLLINQKTADRMRLTIPLQLRRLSEIVP